VYECLYSLEFNKHSLIYFLVLLVSSSTYGSQTCNVHNLVFGPLLECGMKWWQDYDLAVEIESKVTDKLSDVIETLLTYFSVDIDAEINSFLDGNINATTNNSFAKIVESALTIEPYPLFVAADLVLSLGFSAPILNEIGINGDLGTREGLLKMIGEYIDFGCSETYV